MKVIKGQLTHIQIKQSALVNAGFKTDTLRLKPNQRHQDKRKKEKHKARAAAWF